MANALRLQSGGFLLIACCKKKVALGEKLASRWQKPGAQDLGSRKKKPLHIFPAASAKRGAEKAAMWKK